MDKGDTAFHEAKHGTGSCVSRRETQDPVLRFCVSRRETQDPVLRFAA